MIVSLHPADIRDLVFRTFLEFDVSEEGLADLDERMLIDDGKYFARSYRAESLLAMWLVEVGIVQFYDSEGNMLRTVNLFEELRPQRMAA